MMKHLVRTPEQALLYLADCTLATVADMAMKKSKSKHEFQRQIAIAQSAIDWIKDFHIQIEKGSRVENVLALKDQKVETWSKSYNCA
jgi:predicted ABC-type ATPase